MKRLLTACAVTAALASTQVLAAVPGKPTLTEQYANYNGKGFVTVSGEAGAYKSLVTRVDVVELPVTWSPAWSGDAATSWQVLVNGEVAVSGTGAGGSAIVPITSGGLKEIVVRLCNDDGCVDSAADKAIVSDTDGSHLMPLGEQIDSANTNYAQSKDQIVGTYFVEWGIYGRKYFVENVPANNLTHIIYGFIPMCGENKSLKDGNASGWSVLQADCAQSEDYELVIHDMGAAFWRQNGAVKAMKLDGTAVGYGEVGMGNFGHLMALKQGNPHLKIVPSIGGWTLSDPFYGFTDKANRDTFVASSKEFLKTWKFFDGIDIDWEFPGGGGAQASLGDPINDGPAYVALMKELRVMLDELAAETGREYELTSAIGVGWDKIQDVDYAAAAEYMDNIFMMSYDFYGAWGSETGHQTGLYCGAHISADKCAGTGEFGPTTVTDKTKAGNLGRDSYAPAGMPEYTTANATRLLLEQGVPAHKLVVGAAMYGRGWTDVQMVNGSPIGAVGNHVDSSENNPLVAEGGEGTSVDEAAWAWEAGIMDYRGALKFMAANSNAKYVWDSQAEASFIWDEVSSTLITLDTPRSIEAKGVFLQAQGLGGIFSWEIDGDGGTAAERTLNAMNKAVGNAEGITDWGVTPT
ncbi:MAG TPA: chitinase, partial [Colwellia sp.]|nr:chitinase [Colwellia sp.]